jgi:hypothetical protein
LAAVSDTDPSLAPKPPSRPAPYECCNRGCCPCIFDYYEDALERWRAAVSAKGFDPDVLLGETKKAST